ncbi:hypothetical protein A3768_4565 (plasmid) [Ralstonia solanacearum]|nr:hypothetical protein F504_4939 [Ralstonia pseudosolanacearum FQY_4]ANH35374.1 hypothetical protein A3768_4565 [Ralstonia solanacearum]
MALRGIRRATSRPVSHRVSGAAAVRDGGRRTRFPVVFLSADALPSGVPNRCLVGTSGGSDARRGGAGGSGGVRPAPRCGRGAVVLLFGAAGNDVCAWQ